MLQTSLPRRAVTVLAPPPAICALQRITFAVESFLQVRDLHSDSRKIADTAKSKTPGSFPPGVGMSTPSGVDDQK